MSYVLFAIAGICGTPYRKWPFPPPGPQPPPEPWWGLERFVAAGAGVLGGVLVQRSLGDQGDATTLLASAAGALAFGRAAGSVTAIVLGANADRARAGTSLQS